MLILYSAFGKTSKLFPIAVLPFCIPINSVLRLQLEKTLAVADAVKPRIRFQQLCFSSLKWAVVINEQNLTEKSYPFITLQNFFLPLTQGSPIIWKPNYFCSGLPWWLSGKESACQCRRPVLIPGLERSCGGVNGNPLQYSCLGNPMDRGAWRVTAHWVAKR